MASYQPQSQSHHQPPYPTGSQPFQSAPPSVSRGNSYQPSPSPYEQATQPFPPFAPQQPGHLAPIPQQQQVPPQMYQAPPYQPYQNPQQPMMQPGYPNVPMAPYPLGEPTSGSLRPNPDHRRASHSSHRSSRSNASRHSHRSKHSSRYDSGSDSDLEDERPRHHKHHHKKHHGTSKKLEESRPTLGDSMFAVIDSVKDAMFGKKY